MGFRLFTIVINSINLSNAISLIFNQFFIVLSSRRYFNVNSLKYQSLCISFCKYVCKTYLFSSLNDNKRGISRATVYNTLNLFVEKGLVRRVIIDSSKIYYDSKTTPHSHYYNVDTGEISDFEFNDAQISPLPALPEHTVQEGVDIVIRVKNSK